MISFLSIVLTFQRLLCTCNIDLHDEFISVARMLRQLESYLNIMLRLT